MEFGLLGPLEVRSDGGLVPVRRGRPRALLTALLLRVGRVVPVDVLVEEVWGGDPLLDPANAVQGGVSYLRRALGLSARAGAPAPALRTAGAGYVLDVDPERVDVRRFERLVAAAAARLRAPSSRADARLAVEELRSALDLWRGEPLQDVADETFAKAEAQRLRELRAVALEYEVEARLALGDHDQVVPALGQLIAEHPLRERLRAQLVLALYRSGRQADALREFDATRNHLVEELGVEPGPELQRLHHALLAHDPELDWIPPPDVAPAAPRPDRAMHAWPTRLPAATNLLVGRHRELARVRAALGEHRMVTLTGPGGAGKTRLALAVASGFTDERPVWFVELADVGDESVVPFEIAGAVGAMTHDDPLGAFAVGLGERPGLLVLDTCEHVIEACAAAAHRLLRACPALTVLATSRQPLAVPGEVAWPVPPLAVPPPGASLTEVAASEAVRLFSDRSRAVRPDFELDATNAADVAAICRVLDGLPLAIELAAARTAVLSPGRILARLDDRFALLRRVGRAADVRQQSLWAAMQWSHELLDDDQRRFFERLGVFAGRFTFEAAAAVAADGLEDDPLDLLTAVVHRSLVVADGDDAYRLLDSLRAYALDRLGGAPGEQEAARHRLACWLAAYCEATATLLQTEHQDTALARLRAELPNLRASLEWTFAAGDPAVGVRLACSLVWFWGWVGANDECSRWLHRALAVEGLDDLARASLLEGAAMHAFALGNTDAGQAQAQEAARLWADAGVPERGFAALVYRGMAERDRDDLAAAAATHDEAIAAARGSHDDWGLAIALYWRAATAADQGDDDLAARLVEEGLALAQRAGDRRAIGLYIHQQGRIAHRRGDHERAIERAGDALAVHEAIGWRAGIAAALEARGRAELGLGDVDAALASHRRSLAVAMELGLPDAVAKALEGLAAAVPDDDPEAAAAMLGAASSLRSRSRAPIHAAQRRLVEGIERSLRAELGEVRFAAAVARGQGLEPVEVLSDGP